MLIQYELVREPQGIHAPWHRIYITALAAMIIRRSAVVVTVASRIKYSACAKKRLGRVLPSQSRGRRGTHVTDHGSQEQQRQDAKKTMRLPRNDARCKLETRDLPTHCPAKRPKRRLSDGSRTDRRKREHAQLCELARTSPEVSNSCHCNSAIETCAGARIEISKQRRAGSSDIVDEAMRDAGAGR